MKPTKWLDTAEGTRTYRETFIELNTVRVEKTLFFAYAGSCPKKSKS